MSDTGPLSKKLLCKNKQTKKTTLKYLKYNTQYTDQPGPCAFACFYLPSFWRQNFIKNIIQDSFYRVSVTPHHAAVSGERWTIFSSHCLIILCGLYLYVLYAVCCWSFILLPQLRCFILTYLLIFQMFQRRLMVRLTLLRSYSRR